MDFVAFFAWVYHVDYIEDEKKYAQFFGQENVCTTCGSNNNGIIAGSFPLTIKESCSKREVLLHEDTENVIVTDEVLAAIRTENLDVDTIPATVKGKNARPRHVITGRVTTKRWFAEEDLIAHYENVQGQSYPLYHNCKQCGRTAYCITVAPANKVNHQSLHGFGDFVASPEQLREHRSRRCHMMSTRLFDLLRRFDKKVETVDVV